MCCRIRWRDGRGPCAASSTRSLFEAVTSAGAHDQTAVNMADIFQWDIDFVLDIQPKDSFVVTYRELYQNGVYVKDGPVLAAVLHQPGTTYSAVRYVDAEGAARYFTPDGRSLHKAFLRAPVEFTPRQLQIQQHALSPDSQPHPRPQRHRLRRPMGTPVRAAGDGRVIYAGPKGGYGNVVEIDHSRSITTVYGHLSRFAKGTHAGAHVTQGEVVAYVGMTGLATGPICTTNIVSTVFLRIPRRYHCRTPLRSKRASVRISSRNRHLCLATLEAPDRPGTGIPLVDNRPSWIHPISKLRRTTSTASCRSSNSTSGCWPRRSMSRCRCWSGCASCAFPRATWMSSSRSGWRASSSCWSWGRGSSPPTRCRCRSSWRRSMQRAMRLCSEQYRCLNEVLMPALQKQGISLQGRADWSPAAEKWLERYFENEIEPVLSPLGLDPARPFPRIQNKSLNFIVRLRGNDAFGRDSEHAIVQAPRSLPRVVPVPNEGCEKTSDAAVSHRAYLRAEAVCRHRGAGLLPVPGDPQQRPVRRRGGNRRPAARARGRAGASALWRGGAAGDLERLPRGHGAVPVASVRADDVDMYRMPGPVNLNRLSAIYDLVQRPDLKYPIFTPGLPKRLVANNDMFSVIRQNDMLLHHPYQSFAPVMDFVRLAAADPQVLAIKQTLYRAGHESPIVDALVAAANAGKDVTVIVELRARFDEEANIELSNRLQEAGAHVMYGVVGYKTHAKVTLVVRREPGGIRRYCHLGTGNYHPKTARAYTDYGLFTCNDEIGQDVHELFLQLTSLTQTPKLNRLIQSPFGMHDAVIAKLAREAEHARAGRPARVIAKMNALVEPQAIEALYRASCAGVKVDLIIRGVCALRPGVPGVSENITVRSIVGRFLEHSRVFYFENGGEPEMYCASADWMERNFFRRVEVAFPIQRDTSSGADSAGPESLPAGQLQAWELQSDGQLQARRASRPSNGR